MKTVKKNNCKIKYDEVKTQLAKQIRILVYSQSADFLPY
ncbi:hypothetical protein MSIBF_A1060004 [groundwater metagenome]|uniref:Uncharacterized protein n=1 Tax=groundwater metagenome TaxID=717931 RepID=A0A098E5T7_9ZZZZ